MCSFPDGRPDKRAAVRSGTIRRQMETQEIASLAAALALAAIHLLSGKLLSLRRIPRSGWLSAFGGISVAYVFVHLLPELAERQEEINSPGGAGLGLLEDHLYLAALVGVTVFYAVESHSLRSRSRRHEVEGHDRSGDGAFRLSIASFALYNALVGYLLMREELESLSALLLYTLAMGLHFVVNDTGLREHHKHAYDDLGRWLVTGAVLAGWLAGVLTEIPEETIATTLAAIGGGVILNVLKEELPRECSARLGPFVAGAAGYAALLQLG